MLKKIITSVVLILISFASNSIAMALPSCSWTAYGCLYEFHDVNNDGLGWAQVDCGAGWDYLGWGYGNCP